MWYIVKIKEPDQRIEDHRIEAKNEDDIKTELVSFTYYGCKVLSIEPDKKNWGGKRQGAGRKKTGRKKRYFYITDTEAEAITNLIKTMRKSPRE